MNGKTHQLVGVAGSLTASLIFYKMQLFSLPACIATVAASSVGSLIPDIDHVGSTAGKKIPIISYPISFLSKIFFKLYRKTKWKLFAALNDMFSHRGILHSPLFWSLIFVPLFIHFSNNLTVSELTYSLIIGIMSGLFLGIILHILADMLNPTGVPIFMPIYNRKFSMAKIVTGSKGESVFKFIIIFILIATCACIGYNFGLQHNII